MLTLRILIRRVEDKGPNGLGGRITYTYYECATCTKRIAEAEAKAEAKYQDRQLFGDNN